jgi:hypothetical protein
MIWTLPISGDNVAKAPTPQTAINQQTRNGNAAE